MKNDQYFPHDATAGNNIKLMILIETEGARGYGVYWFLLEFLRQQTDYKGKLSMLDMLARRVKTTRAVVRRIIMDYALFAIEGELFYSPGLVDRMQPLDSKRAAKSEQCRRAAGTKWLKTSKSTDADALQGEERKEEQRKEENTTSPKPSPGTLPREGEKEEGGGNSSVKAPPEYALNKQTHNLKGLMERLQQLKVNNPQEVNAILQLSDYGRMGTKVWSMLYHTEWNSIKAPGRFLIAGLRKEVT
ncbi:Lin1244/Lin1753 domain-containing protein [Bacteroides sp. 51]|uniref:Lin1244/Lin1753 domain-containing protein n=1 Tax=Bacteroides sp. 51 TaxID=2302938 RepID=UPI0013D4F5B5|nr:Lin1244/Lin1753 domain-containing protein [Bacteroides sp. 51]NDV83825.1 DUF4373 domain-containing protein [Bacteroides sp. 51]